MVLKRGGLALALAVVLCAGCESTKYQAIDRPTPEQMRTALKNLLKEHPEYSLPEFELSLEQSRIVQNGSMVRIGSFDCDMDTLMFDASFSAPTLTLKQLTGRFQTDVRHDWKATILRSKVATAHEPSRRFDWYPSDAYSWSLGGDRR